MRNRSIVSPRKDLLNSIYMLIVVFSKHKEMVSHNEGDFFRCGNDAQLVGGSKISQTDRGGDHQRTKYRYASSSWKSQTGNRENSQFKFQSSVKFVIINYFLTLRNNNKTRQHNLSSRCWNILSLQTIQKSKPKQTNSHV